MTRRALESGQPRRAPAAGLAGSPPKTSPAAFSTRPWCTRRRCSRPQSHAGPTRPSSCTTTRQGLCRARHNRGSDSVGSRHQNYQIAQGILQGPRCSPTGPRHHRLPLHRLPRGVVQLQGGRIPLSPRAAFAKPQNGRFPWALMDTPLWRIRRSLWPYHRYATLPDRLLRPDLSSVASARAGASDARIRARGPFGEAIPTAESQPFLPATRPSRWTWLRRVAGPGCAIPQDHGRRSQNPVVRTKNESSGTK